MTKVLPANRVAAIATWLTGLGGLVTGGVAVFPQTWQNGAVAVGGLLVTLGTGVTFMLGSQKVDAHEAQLATAKVYAASDPQPAAPPATDAAPEQVSDEVEFRSVPPYDVAPQPVAVDSTVSPADYDPQSALHPDGQPGEVPVQA